MFNITTEQLIKQEIELLIRLIHEDKKIKDQHGIINEGIAQKRREQRLSQEIEAFTSDLIQTKFNNNKKKFTYLKKIEENNGSTKAPYELLMIFNLPHNNELDVYVDLKPINILKKVTSPFMGTIVKYIKRINEKKYYDVYFVVKYTSETNKLPAFQEIKFYFVKNIQNFFLYQNWQLQLPIKKHIQTQSNTTPATFLGILKKLLEKLKDKGVKRIIQTADKLLKKIDQFTNTKTENKK